MCGWVAVGRVGEGGVSLGYGVGSWYRHSIAKFKKKLSHGVIGINCSPYSDFAPSLEQLLVRLFQLDLRVYRYYCRLGSGISISSLTTTCNMNCEPIGSLIGGIGDATSILIEAVVEVRCIKSVNRVAGNIVLQRMSFRQAKVTSINMPLTERITVFKGENAFGWMLDLLLTEQICQRLIGSEISLHY